MYNLLAILALEGEAADLAGDVVDTAGEVVGDVTSNVSDTASSVLRSLGINLGSIALSSVVSAVVILIVCLIATKAICGMVSRVLDHSKLDKTLHTFIKSAIRAVLYVISAIIVVGSMGFDVSSLVAALSVAGLAVSLAMQNSLSNLAGGIMILVSKPFLVGDFVDTAGGTGTVAEIGLAYTKLNTLDNKIIFVPNSTISSANIVNYSTEGKRRVDLDFTVSYDNDTATVKQALRDSIGRCENIITDPEPFIRISAYNDSNITYTVRVWCKNADYWDVYFFLMEDVRESFAAHQVEMTYNHLNVHMVNK